jgi:hypothetical protein
MFGALRLTTADTESTEEAQRKAFKPLCYLCALCVSVVNTIFHYTQSQTNLLLLFTLALPALMLLAYIASHSS